jgi:trimeric autotransporter adhesin
MTTTVSGSYPAVNSDSDATINGLTVGKGGGAVATNTAVGYQAINASATGGTNTAVGYQAVYSNTTGTANTALGLQALYANTTAGSNTAIGYQSAVLNTTGANNTAIGESALRSNTTASNSTAVGYQALYSSTTNGGNTALGNLAGYKATGLGNVFIGNSAAYWQTTSNYNTVCGDSAGGLSGTALTGNHNTSIGNSAGQSIQGAAAYNTFVGSGAGIIATTAQSNIIIGYGADVTSAGAANQITLGINTAGNGDNYFSFGKASNIVYNQFTANSSWARASDVRLKKDIQDDNLGLDFICKIQPRTFKWKPSNEVPQELTRHYSEENNMDLDVTMNGFIAQEVKQALDDVGAGIQGVWFTELDGTQAVSREMFIMPLINAIKELKAEVDSLKQQLGN